MMRLLIIFLFGITLAPGGFSQESHQWLLEGDDLYRKGEFEKAEEAYRKAAEAQPELKSKYNLGNTVYHQTRYDEAVDYYKDAISRATDAGHRSQAYYNLGNAHFMAQQFDKSVKAYKEALKLDPDDRDAKKNLSMAQRLLKQQQQQQQQGGEQGEGEQQEQQESQASDSEESQEQQEQQSSSEQQQEKKEGKEDRESEGDQESANGEQQDEQDTSQGNGDKKDLSKEEAARLLRIMEQEDQKVQEKLRRSSGRKNKSEKEW